MPKAKSRTLEAKVLWQNRELDTSEDADTNQIVIRIVSYNSKAPQLEKREFYWDGDKEVFLPGKAKGFLVSELKDLLVDDVIAKMEGFQKEE